MKNVYNWETYSREKQLVIDAIGVGIIGGIGYSLQQFDRSKHINNLIDCIIQNGGNINEGFASALLINALLLKVKNVVLVNTNINPEVQKNNIRIIGACLGAVLISMVEIFLNFGNSPDVKDIPAGIIGAFLAYMISKKSIEPIFKNVPCFKPPGKTRKRKK